MDNLLNFDFNFIKYLNKKFNHILYRDSDHSYFNQESGNRLISVTQALKKFEPDNWKFILKACAKKLGITPEELQADWNEKARIGQERGTFRHNYLEKRQDREIFEEVIPCIESYLKNCEDITISKEIVIGNDIIGGRLDNLSLRPSKDKLVLKDWKFNKKFETTSKYKLCNGLQHLPNCEFYKYALQVSLYKYILDIDCDLEVIWFNEDDYTIFEVPYLKDEVELILNTLRNENK